MFCAVISVGCGGSSSSDSEPATEEESTTGRENSGWENLSGGFALVSGVWRISSVFVETTGIDIPTWTVDMSSLNRDIKLFTTTEDLLWAYADTPNNFPMLPLTATAASSKGETRTFNIIAPATGFEQDDDDNNVYSTPEGEDFSFDSITTSWAWPWDSITFIHSEGDYVTETKLQNISYDN